VTATRSLTPLRCGGYGLPVPPRSGVWYLDPTLSSIELRVRELHRTSVLQAPAVDGVAQLTETAGTSSIELRFGPPSTHRASTGTGNWMRFAGLDSQTEPLRYGSGHVLASPHGWRMCGRLQAEHLDELLIADARIHDVYTRLDGHDAMDVIAVGAIRRPRSRQLGDALLRSRVTVRVRAHLVHD